MSVKIRLKRMGAKKHPFYRIVVANSTNARDGKFIETVGHFDPLLEQSAVTINVERVKYWLSVGAQPTDVTRALLVKQGVLEPKKFIAASK